MKIPTGGKAHEPKGRFGVTPKPTVRVWMKEDGTFIISEALRYTYISELFLLAEVFYEFNSNA